MYINTYIGWCIKDKDESVTIMICRVCDFKASLPPVEIFNQIKEEVKKALSPKVIHVYAGINYKYYIGSEYTNKYTNKFESRCESILKNIEAYKENKNDKTCADLIINDLDFFEECAKEVLERIKENK